MRTILEENVLNVTLLQPREKHPAIFDRFEKLEEGQSMVIYNDHDPKPLYYQMLGEKGNIFSWEYIEQGPNWWKVRITKRRQGESEMTMGEIAAADIRKAQVFKKYGLDFCCGGKKTVLQACQEKGLDVTQVEYELQHADKTSTSMPVPFTEWEPDFLADYIVNVHHRYVKKALPDLTAYMKKVEAVHGKAHPELTEIKSILGKVNTEMTTHMMKEEEILFPFIKTIANSVREGQQIQSPVFGKVSHPVHMMETEHETVGFLLEQIRLKTKNFSLPDDACVSYSLLYKMLEEFETDLHLHVHLENNILFPKAMEMERKVNYR